MVCEFAMSLDPSNSLQTLLRKRMTGRPANVPSVSQWPF